MKRRTLMKSTTPIWLLVVPALRYFKSIFHLLCVFASADSSSPFLLSLAMTYSNSCIYSYDPIARRARLEDLNVNRKLKRRYVKLAVFYNQTKSPLFAPLVAGSYRSLTGADVLSSACAQSLHPDEFQTDVLLHGIPHDDSIDRCLIDRESFA